MYSTILTLHSWVRWAVLLAGVFAFVRAAAGWSGRRPWTAADNRAGLVFVSALDLQVLVGLWLYFVLSPFTTGALRDFGAAMRLPDVRYWVVEHPFGMLLGVVLAHIGRVQVRRAADAVRKHKRATIFFGIALLAIAVSVPWPGSPNGRDLFRW
jgi:hypothetical protein